MYFFLLSLGMIVTSLLGVWAYGQAARRSGILDHPNARSLHTIPTPRGAGIVTMILVLLSGALCFGAVPLATPLQQSVFAGGLLVGLVSWRDDLRPLSAWQRLLAHSAAALLPLASYALAGPQPGGLAGGPLPSLLGGGLLFLWIVGLVNAYNFMDGVDGIAATQAALAGTAQAAFGHHTGRPELCQYGILFAAATSGLVMFTWQPARVFMGDCGSAFIGYTLATLPLLLSEITSAASRSPWRDVLFIACVLSAFLFDTLFTFSKRLLRGERVYQAHRTHFYQQMAGLGWPHRTITLLYALLSLGGTVVALSSAKTITTLLASSLALCIGNGLVLHWVVFRLGKARLGP